MEINSTGITKSDLTDYLSFWTDKLRGVYGNNFNIKKEGLIDNVATASSLTSLALEDVMLYFAKQLNPYTAEGEFQDILYSYIGLERRYADFTVVTRTIGDGSANLVCPAGSIRFKNTSTDDIFELNTEVTLDANGKGVGSFTAIELGAIDLQPNDILEIIDSPEPNMTVYYEEGDVTNIGDDYEDNSEFRLRWLATRSVLPTSKTEGGLRTALLDLVENEHDLKIRQNRGNTTLSDGLTPHSLEVVIKSGYSNNDIAQKILDHVTDGVGLYGSTTVTLQDSEDTDVDVSFTRATEVPIYFNVEYVGNSGLESAIKNAIVDNFTYPMGERVVANDFYRYINDIDGLDYVTRLEIKTEDDLGYSQTIPMSYDEYSTVIASHIEVSEYE